MAEKAKKTTNTKKTTTKKTTAPKKVAKPEIKSTVSGKKACCEKPALSKVICLVVAAVAILVIIVAVMVPNLSSINGNYFVSDGTKYVLNIEADEPDEDGMVASHSVYYYKDDAITGVEVYYEFKDEATAKTFYDALMETLAEDEEADDEATYKLKGKYLIAVANEDSYKDLTASDVKSYIELYENINNSDDTDETEESEE
ncbi:hypothetical protein IKF57_01700 [Candidatus Saccharibacteria bacterium]|nr:hypothetical protein [Candidatus Saccharibacteria bacterium]